ncbi:MAG: efflux RND transporter periplasmic adaptor subunit [Syntrophus sp. (in: bacteria)]|nr:efflux RND transporter periplasmic adaptor subunit [Syntrophus sp. (in: bacteria)]
MAENDLSRLKIDKSQAVGVPGKKKRFIYWIVGAFLIILISFLYFKGFFSGAVQVEVANVARIYPSQTFTLLNASGYVVPQRKAAVASKITGRIVALNVEEGNRIKKGEIIARLENDDIAASGRQAAANLDVARFNLEQAKAEMNDAALAYGREKNLLAKEFATKASYDTAEARYKKALAAVSGAEAVIRASAAALKVAEWSLEYTMIRAPFDGVVLTKNADVGDIVTPLGAAANAKASAVTIADLNSLMVEADVSESNLGKVKLGQPCEIQLDAIPDTRFRAAVHMIVPTADRSKATVMVKVRFIDKDARILPEMSAKVAFLSREVGAQDEKPRTAIVRKAIIDRNGKKYVFLIAGNRVTLTPITTGAQLGDMIEVQSGLNTGDKVVARPSDRLKNGDRIKFAEQ